MLSLLLAAAAAIDTYATPAALCPPCHEEEPDTVFGFIVSMIKSLVSMLVIVFPLYKTFKAFESNRLRACRTMLAYWSAMTLLNALKDVTDEIVGKHINTTIHHLLLAAIKIAPLVLGPDKIYDMTVRSFFEHHEAEMDAMVLAGTEKAAELKEKIEPTLDKVKDQVAKMEAKVEPTIEQIRESLRESVDTVKSSLGMETEQTETADSSVVAELSAEEAVRRDEELTVVEDSTSKTGLRQRSAKLGASSNSPTGVTAEVESEIERAKARNVLVEKIVWGHGLSAKNEEYQRQVKEKEVAQDEVVAGVHTVANQFNTVPARAPVVDNLAYNKSTTATTTTTTAATTTNATAATNTTATAPPLPPRPVATEAITITNSTVQPTTTTTSTASAAPLSHSSASSTVSTARSSTTVLDSRSVAASGGKTILLDTRSIPSVVETYATDYQKEL